MNNNIEYPKQPVENNVMVEDSAVFPIPERILNKSFEADENMPDDVRDVENEINNIGVTAGSDSDSTGTGFGTEHPAIGSENEENNYHDLGGES